MSKSEADNAESAYAKFVDESVLGFGYQLAAGTTLFSDGTDWRLLTSVDSLDYQSVGFEVTIGKNTHLLTSNKVYKTIYGYGYKDAYNYNVSYTPQETFSAASKYFMAYKLTGIPNSAFTRNIKVTPVWTTLDGTMVIGIGETFSIDDVLCDCGDNLQISKGTDFEGFATLQLTNSFSMNYANYSGGSVSIINDGNNTYAKLRPVENGGYATITKSCDIAVLKKGTYRLSMDVKLGSSADGTVSFGIWDGVAWVPGWPMTVIDIGEAKADDWTKITYEYTLAEDKTGGFANLDIGYQGVSVGANNYVMIDNIQIIDIATNTNIDIADYGNFEGVVTQSPVGLLQTSGWKADTTGNGVIYVGDANLENEVVVEENGNKCFKFYTSTGFDSSVDFAGNTAFAGAGTYKMSVKAKMGAEAINVDNIGFRFYAQGGTLETGDVTFQTLNDLSSDEWVTLEAYFTVPETIATDFINMNFWAFTHNNEIGSTENYVLMDDIEVCPVVLKECAHEYVYEYTTEPTATAEGEVIKACKFNCAEESETLKVMKTPRLYRDGLKLSWDAIDNAVGYKLYDGDTVVADIRDALSYTIAPVDEHEYTLEAYTDVEGYHNFSNQSNTVNVTVSFGDNLQTSKGTDFEGFATQQLINSFSANYANYSSGNIKIINAGNNTYAKLQPVENGGSAIITRSCDIAVLERGTYRLSMDVKLGSSADGTVSFGIWDGVAWSPEWPMTVIDIGEAKADGWTTVTYEYTLAEDKTGEFANLDIGYQGVNAGADNYVMIDNIQIIDSTINTNVDEAEYGDFEGVVTQSPVGLLQSSGWRADATGNNVIYVGDTNLENEVVVEENGNKCFKFYTSTGTDASVDFAGNTAFAGTGNYKISIKAKLGSEATRVDNIGFRLYPETILNGTSNEFDGLEELNSDEWVTLEAYFTVPKTVTTDFINMNFWAFTHNDEIGSAENYVLMDDIEVYPVTLNGKKLPVYSPDLIASVYDGGVITGVLAPEDTVEKYNIGGTDLGFPYYDSTREQMYLLFGDTFSSINTQTRTDWRSQTVGISKDFDLADGLTFDSFVSDEDGKATHIVYSPHDKNTAGGERTSIPTGGIVVDGTHYVFYMSVRKWITEGGSEINFCAVAKSTDGQKFEVQNNLFWSDTATKSQRNVVSILGQTADAAKTHAASNFLQIFPYMNEKDGYIYLFGLSTWRSGGVKWDVFYLKISKNLMSMNTTAD